MSRTPLKPFDELQRRTAKHSRLLPAAVAGALFFVAGSCAVEVARAEGDVNKPIVVPSLQAFKVTRKDDKETFVPAPNARPGDLIEYRAAYENQGRTRVSNLLATLPIPQGTVFQNSSAIPETALASLDGRAFSSMPLKRTVKTPQGEKQVLVPLSEYRALRWRLESLAPGQTIRVLARVRVAPSSN